MFVKKIETREEQAQAFAIRQEVFVIEQQVPPEEEYDEFEEISSHFLAYSAEGLPCGTARWRFTDKGIKLERFAVRKAYRSQKVGSALLQKVLEDIHSHPNTQGKIKYLHAQLTAMGLYQKFGFVAVGDMFEECAIQHYQMILQEE